MLISYIIEKLEVKERILIDYTTKNGWLLIR